MFSEHRYGRWVLAAIAFTDSSFLPIPPDLLLVPMALVRPKQSPQPCRCRACPAQAGGPHRRARWETLRHTVNQDGPTGRALTTGGSRLLRPAYRTLIAGELKLPSIA